MIDISKLPDPNPELSEALKPLFHLLEQPEYEGTTVVVKIAGADVYRTSCLKSAANSSLLERFSEDHPDFPDLLSQMMEAISPLASAIEDQLAAIGLIKPGTAVYGVEAE